MLDANDNAKHSLGGNDTSKLGKLAPGLDGGHYEETNGKTSTPSCKDRGKHHHSITDLWRAIVNNPSAVITPTVAPKKYMHREDPQAGTERLVPEGVATYLEKGGNGSM